MVDQNVQVLVLQLFANNVTSYCAPASMYEIDSIVGVFKAEKRIKIESKSRVFFEMFGARIGRALLRRAPIVPQPRVCRVRFASNNQSKFAKKLGVPSVPPELQPSAARGLFYGIGIGAVGSMVGIGGGILAMPIFTGSCGLAQIQANAAASALNACTSSASTASYAFAGLTNVGIAAVTGVAAAAATPFGVAFASRMPNQLLRRLVGISCLIISPVIAFKPQIIEYFNPKQSKPDVDVSPLVANVEQTEPQSGGLGFKQIAFLSSGGAVVGFVAALTGVGAGIMLTSMLSLSPPSLVGDPNMNHKRAVSTSLMGVTLPFVAAMISHYRRGNMPRVRLLPGLLVGTFIGSTVGALLQNYALPESWSRSAFAGFLVYLAIHTLRR
jgi:uncharacterized membrane protein YfcA